MASLCLARVCVAHTARRSCVQDAAAPSLHCGHLRQPRSSTKQALPLPSLLMGSERRYSITVAHAAASSASSLTDQVLEGLEEFFPAGTVDRVKKSLEMTNADQEVVKEWDRGRQVASSYIEGLLAEPFHDAQSSDLDLAWWLHLEQNFSTIQQEFISILDDEKKLSQGVSVWVPAVDRNAVDYGKEWRTLVLQDRGRWEEANTKIFPKTAALIQKIKAPSLEVFFAKQPPGTGIKPHTDNSNFIMTGHLALQIPQGDCWIKCGNEVKQWEEGRSLIMDTSFIHSTANNTPFPRFVLIVRFWHPQLTQYEKLALQFVFDAIDAQSTKSAKKNLQRGYKALGIRKRL